MIALERKNTQKQRIHQDQCLNMLDTIVTNYTHTTKNQTGCEMTHNCETLTEYAMITMKGLKIKCNFWL